LSFKYEEDHDEHEDDEELLVHAQVKQELAEYENSQGFPGIEDEIKEQENESQKKRFRVAPKMLVAISAGST